MPWKKKSTRTEIVHIVVTGYQKKKQPSKYYVFVIDVTWNNSERFEVYRRYSDFFSFQTTLKALFPGAAGRRNNEERVIPQLPKRIFVGRSHVAKVAEARLEQINRYCQTLISLDPRMSESAHVVGFFSPRIGDKELPKLHLHRPASLHPEKVPLGNIFEEHCALAEYVAEDASQVSFKPGDKVLVMSKDVSGWWMCGVDGKVGWAPPSYLKKCEDTTMENDSEESDDEFSTNQRGKDSDDSGVGDPALEPTTLESSLRKFVAPEITAEAYRAIDSYQATGAGQVSFEIGDTIHVLDKLEDGWWFVSNGREEGWAPCSYLEGDKEEEVVTNLENIEKYYTVDNYQAEEEDEISFQKGITLDVLQKSLDGWWVVKIDKIVGLAPATFLKKVELLDSDQAQSPSSQNAERKLSPPMAAISPLLAFQQPPRKQSVRARASRRGNLSAGGHGANKKPSPLTALSPIPASPTPPSSAPPPPKPERKQEPRPPRQGGHTPASKQERTRRKSLEAKSVMGCEVSPPRRRSEDMLLIPGQLVKPVAKEPMPIPRSPQKVIPPREQSTSPELSDSDPEENYTNFSFIESQGRGKQRSHSTGSSFMSDDGPKRPVATPRKCKSPSLRGQVSPTPPLPPKPDSIEPRPPLPPRPINIPKILKQSSFPEEPARPMRPRPSEIKRAKGRARAANKSKSPMLTIVDEDGFETRSAVSNKSSKSSASNFSSKSAPPDVHKLRTRTDAEATQFLIPGTQNRNRRGSANDGLYSKAQGEVASSAPAAGTGGDLMAGALDTQVADKILKYIMSSGDPGMQAVLRDIVKESVTAGKQ